MPKTMTLGMIGSIFLLAIGQNAFCSMYFNGERILLPKLADHLFKSSVYIVLVGTRNGLHTLVPKLV